ncbi:MAG: hypothetical protein ACR2FO_00895 [Actinomycetota bacterium]
MAVLLSACRQPSGASVEKRPAEVRVTMKEHEFEMPGSLTTGALTFRVHNEGLEDHDLTLIQLPETLDRSLDEQLRGERRMSVLPIAQIKSRSPGKSGFFAVDLDPGKYGIICFVRGPDKIPHARKGMSREFVIEAPDARGA